MSQPDSPLYDGLGAEWNDIVGAFPEDKRTELAGVVKSRIDSYEPLKQYQDLHKSGITADQAGQALNLYSVMESDPRRIYDAIGQHLGITPQQAQAVVEELEEDDDDTDPRLKSMQQQLETIGQIMLMNKQQETQAQLAAEGEASLQKDLDGLKKKYGDIDEQEVIFRMLHANMTPDQAYQDYTKKFEQIRARRPAPFIMGGGGQVPQKSIDPTKLDPKDTRRLVAQMMQHGNEEAKA